MILITRYVFCQVLRISIRVQKRIELPKGEPEFPVTDDERKNKFMSLAKDLVSDERADRIWEMGMCIKEMDDLAEFTTLLRAE